MEFPLEPAEALAVLAVIVLGSAVQAAVGFGLGLIAAPVLLLLHWQLVPGPLMAAGIVLTFLVAYRERADIDFGGLRFALVGRLLGTVVAALLLTSLSLQRFEFVFAGVVLLAVLLSVAGFQVSPSPGSAAAAGALSGFMATLSSIGGPPMALLYQQSSGARLRATLSGYFVVGTLISLAALAAVGRYRVAEILLTLYLVPGVLLGYFAAGRIRAIVDRAGVRPLVLALSFASAVAVLVRALLRG